MNSTLNGIFNNTISNVSNVSPVSMTQRNSFLRSRKAKTSHNKYALKVTGVRSNSKTTINSNKKKVSPKRAQIPSSSKAIIKLGSKKWPKRNLSGPKVSPKHESLKVSHFDMGGSRDELYSTFVNQPKLTKRYKNSIERSSKRTLSRKASNSKTSRLISELLAKPNSVLFNSKPKFKRNRSPKVVTKPGM